MGLRTTLKEILGTAWHVAHDAFFEALVPAVDGTVEAGKPVVADANKDVTGIRNLTVTGAFAPTSIGAHRETARNLRTQAAAAAKTTSVTLTAAEIMAGLITGNQGAAAGAAYTLPLGADLETALVAAFPGLANDDSFDFSVINISTVAAEVVTIVTNTGWTLVGDMTLAANATGDQSGGLFRARRTAANTYTLYRI